ncbi:hypothetical protein Gpo141_00003520 [Globisporangium polare]
MKAKVAHVLKTYGRTALLFHTAVFASTFSGAYAAIRSGVDLRDALNKVPFVDLSKMDPEAGTLALAYVSTLATGPARGALTITAVPFLARLFSRHARRVPK